MTGFLPPFLSSLPFPLLPLLFLLSGGSGSVREAKQNLIDFTFLSISFFCLLMQLFTRKFTLGLILGKVS